MQNKKFIRIPHLQKQSVGDICYLEYFKYVTPLFAEGTFPPSLFVICKRERHFPQRIMS